MIMLHFHDGNYDPVVVCDICEQRITDANSAGAVSIMVDGSHPELIKVLHVHKGKCLDTAETKLRGKQKTGWDELGDHLLHLVEGAGLKSEDLVKLKKFLNDAGI